MKKLLIAFVVVVALSLIWARYPASTRPDFTRSSDTRAVDSYRIVAYRHGSYVIDHRGIRLTAKCRYSLSWLDGNDKPGKPMDDHDCTYMHGLLGKSVGEDLMEQRDHELIYYPWKGVNTVQTADFLDISNEEAK